MDEPVYESLTGKWAHRCRIVAPNGGAQVEVFGERMAVFACGRCRLGRGHSILRLRIFYRGSPSRPDAEVG